jgi:hypothetical protein
MAATLPAPRQPPPNDNSMTSAIDIVAFARSPRKEKQND